MKTQLIKYLNECLACRPEGGNPDYENGKDAAYEEILEWLVNVDADTTKKDDPCANRTL